MTVERRLSTSKSVSEGHPDKVVSRVSGTILGAISKQDPTVRVACEMSVTTGLVLISGEISATAYIDIQKVVWETIKEIGYTRAKFGFDGDTTTVLVAIGEQSPDIAQGADEVLEIQDKDKKSVLDGIGADDQGLMFEFTVDETPELVLLPIALGHCLVWRSVDLHKSSELMYLHPDTRSQVTVECDDQGQPERVNTIAISAQHNDAVDSETIRHGVIEEVVKEVIPVELLDDRTKYYINPAGRFIIDGPQGDARLTGRKIIADIHGSYARHGGGAFSGKDTTKANRSVSCATRYIAKNIAVAGPARRAEVQPAYAIGATQPVSTSINTSGTGTVLEEELIAAVRENFGLRPAGIIKMLDLRRPTYKQAVACSHFGRTDVDLLRERTDRVDALKTSLAK